MGKKKLPNFYQTLLPFMEGAQGAFAWLDLKGNLEYINQHFQDLFGYTLEDMSTFDMWHRKVQVESVQNQKVDFHWNTIISDYLKKNKRIPYTEITVTCKDNSTRLVSIDGTLIIDHILVSFNDLTRHRQLEQALHKLNRSIRTLSACNEVLVRSTDEDSLLNKVCELIVEFGGYGWAWVGYKMVVDDERVCVVARAGADFLDSSELSLKEAGLESGSLGTALRIGKVSVLNDFEKEPLAVHELGFSKGYSSSISLPLLDGDLVLGVLNIASKEKNAFDEGVVSLLVELANDLAYGILSLRTQRERKQIETILSQQNERLETILDNIPVMIIYFDQQGNFVWANKRWEKISGYTLEEGRSDALETSFTDSQSIQEVKKEILSSDNIWRDHKVRTKDGRWLDIAVVVMPLSDGSVISIGIDVSERKQMETMMIASEKMASLGTLAAGIAHEINSPLQVITGISETLKEKIIRKEIQEERLLNQLQVINRNGWRIAEITRSLLTYARSEPEGMEERDLNEIVRDTERLIDHQLKTWSNIRIEMELSENLPLIICNHGQIGQVIINLLNNARDAMPSGGFITIRTGIRENNGHRVFLQIADTGTGIPDEIRSRIFDPFFTTKPEGYGTGLGLSILAGIVRAHGGEVEVDSEKGKGTIFTVMLPNHPPNLN